MNLLRQKIPDHDHVGSVDRYSYRPSYHIQSSAIDHHAGPNRLRMYQKGDSLKRVAWKQYAKTQQLMTKQYLDYQGDERCLDWSVLSGFDVEYRLQVLCGWALQAHQQQSEFSLKIPGQTIPLGSGEQHLHQCLKALALFNYGVKK